ncbi:hypothetical protein KKF03_05585 [Patescibacteria group bacterium]|nr:hypothetical protein [Patescibacteria group bacterium]
MSYPSDGWETGDKKGKEATKQKLRAGRLKFVTIKKGPNHLSHLFWNMEHSDAISKLFAEVGDAVFEGAGLVDADECIWGSPTCLSKYCKDRPADLSLQSRLSSQLREKIKELLRS